MNLFAIRAIYMFEMHRWWRTLAQSIISPVLSTSLYFIVFGSAIGSRMSSVDGVPYPQFIVPGMLMLAVLTESLSNASFGIYFPKFSGTIYELLSAPISVTETVIGYVGAAASKSVILGLIILVTALLFVHYRLEHPILMLFVLIAMAVTFSLFGFIIGLWSASFQQLQFIPMLIITPLTFLGGAFYSLHQLPALWQKVTLFNPVIYLMSGFRWTFFGKADVSLAISAGITLAIFAICLSVIIWVFKTGYRLKT